MLRVAAADDAADFILIASARRLLYICLSLRACLVLRTIFHACFARHARRCCRARRYGDDAFDSFYRYLLYACLCPFLIDAMSRAIC